MDIGQTRIRRPTLAQQTERAQGGRIILQEMVKNYGGIVYFKVP